MSGENAVVRGPGFSDVAIAPHSGRMTVRLPSVCGVGPLTRPPAHDTEPAGGPDQAFGLITMDRNR